MDLNDYDLSQGFYAYTHTNVPTRAEVASGTRPRDIVNAAGELENVARLIVDSRNGELDRQTSERYAFNNAEFERLIVYRSAVQAGYFNEGIN